MRRKLCGLFLLACVLESTSAYNTKHIQGLSNSFVLSVEQKPNGEMLFGTIDGLDHYDGAHVWSADYHDKTNIRGRVIEKVMSVNKEQTWVLTNYGLNVITPREGQNRFYPQFAGLRKMKRNPQGDGFLLDGNHLCYMGSDGSFLSLSLKLGDNHVPWPCDYVVTDHQVLVFQNHRILEYEIHPTKDGKYRIGRYRERPANISVAVESHDKEYIIDNRGMLLTYSYATGQFKELLSLNNELATRGSINDILEFNGQLLLAFSTGGLISITLPETPEKPAKITDLGIDTGVFCLTKDRFNNIVWIGTDGEGVLMLSDEPYIYRAYTGKSIFTDQQRSIRALLLDKDHTLWVGSKGDGLLCIPHFSINNSQKLPQGTHYNDKTSGLESRNIYCLLESKDGQYIWIGHDQGVTCYDKKNQHFTRMQLPRYAANVMAISERNGRLWMVALGNGIVSAHIVQEGNHPQLSDVKRYCLDGGNMSSNYFFCMAEDCQGRLLFGNRGKGLYKLEHDLLKHVPFGDTEQTPNLNDVFALKNIEGRLWIGTSAGIIILNADNSTKHINTSHGLPSNTIHAFTRSSNGDVWASTSAGLAAFNKRGTIIKVIDDNTIPGIREYCDGAAYHAGNDLFFGAINGFVAIGFNAKSAPNTYTPQIDFNQLSIQGIRQDINEFIEHSGSSSTLRLDYQQNFFTIGVATYDYLEASMLNYYYRLSTHDKWIDNGHSNTFSFSKMPPGHYTLYVKTRNIGTNEEGKEQQLHIVITPPWYLQWWAYTIYVLLIIGICMLLFHLWRLQQRRKHEMEIARLQMQHHDEIYENKMRFLTNVVHELNTPLTLIYGPCERILSHGGTDDFIRKYIFMIIQNLQRLSKLIQEVIDLRKVTSGHHIVKIRCINISALVNDDAMAFTEMAERNNINYEFHIDSDIEWNTDETAIHSIAGNLISNAFKYTKSGGNIRVTLKKDADKIHFTVYNTGQGITPEDCEHIFDDFTVFDSVDENEASGQTSRNGLGLAICYNMVKLLGGDINVESTVGEYTTFHVTLPQQQLPAYVQEDDSSENPAMIRFPLPPVESPSNHVREQEPEETFLYAGNTTPTILAIDDNHQLLELLTDSLHGYHILTANSAEEGIHLLKQESVDLIITDIMMPDTNGLDFTQQVKSNKHTMHIPLIILSAKSSDEELIEGLECGADMYIKKPFSIKYLNAAINRLLENSNTMKEYYNSSAAAFTYSSGTLINKESQEFIKEVKCVINKCMDNTNFDSNMLADMLKLSRRNLYRKFELAQLPPVKEFIRDYRINAAARLLTTTSMTILEVMYKTGYDSRSTFYKDFNKRFNMTPKNYRESLQLKDETL